ncbi:MAG: GNAT family N-acetyltransferase [Hyphomicrobiaceae bacterium]|nr:GNAT family N-acetyltransferase [Hyphomicrobiaceae bacterium]
MTSGPEHRIDSKLISLLWAEGEAAADIARLHRSLFQPAWDEAAIRDLVYQQGVQALVAKVRLRDTGPPIMVGFVVGRVAADEGEILTLGVMTELQRRGIGLMLVDGIARALTGAGATRLFLEVAADNPGAIALYRDRGFAEVGRRRGYYARPGRPAADALVLEKRLEQGAARRTAGL